MFFFMADVLNLQRITFYKIVNNKRYILFIRELRRAYRRCNPLTWNRKQTHVYIDN